MLTHLRVELWALLKACNLQPWGLAGQVLTHLRVDLWALLKACNLRPWGLAGQGANVPKSGQKTCLLLQQKTCLLLQQMTCLLVQEDIRFVTNHIHNRATDILETPVFSECFRLWSAAADHSLKHSEKTGVSRMSVALLWI